MPHNSEIFGPWLDQPNAIGTAYHGRTCIGEQNLSPNGSRKERESEETIVLQLPSKYMPKFENLPVVIYPKVSTASNSVKLGTKSFTQIIAGASYSTSDFYSTEEGIPMT